MANLVIHFCLQQKCLCQRCLQQRCYGENTGHRLITLTSSIFQQFLLPGSYKYSRQNILFFVFRTSIIITSMDLQHNLLIWFVIKLTSQQNKWDNGLTALKFTGLTHHLEAAASLIEKQNDELKSQLQHQLEDPTLKGQCSYRTWYMFLNCYQIYGVVSPSAKIRGSKNRPHLSLSLITCSQNSRFPPRQLWFGNLGLWTHTLLYPGTQDCSSEIKI